MKHLLLLSTFVLFFTKLYAQVLTSDEMLKYGSSMHYKYVTNYSSFDISSTGNNAVWDFSTLTLDGSATDLVLDIVDPSTTPYASSFTNSNYGYKEVKGSNTNYRYFNLTSSKLERVGSYTTFTKTYSDPQVEYVFPLQLNTANNDTWANSSSSTGGTYNLTCLATGTLKLPNATYNNVLFVKANAIESFINFDTYFWYDSDNGAILFQYINGDGFWVADQAMYLSSLTVGSGTITSATSVSDYMQAMTYNNPVNTSLNLDFNLGYTFSGQYMLYNTNGELMANNTIVNQDHFTLPCENLKQGLYLLTFMDEKNPDQKRTIRFIKE
jgi:hypothetical protein